MDIKKPKNLEVGSKGSVKKVLAKMLRETKEIQILKLTILAAIAVLLLSLVGASVLGIAAYDSGRISVEGRAEVAQAGSSGAGVSIHTKVAGPDGTATVKSGDTATFTLTVTNPSGKPAKVEFTLPTGFTFRKMVGGSLGVGNPTQSAGKLTWTNVPARNGTIVFETKAP